jgi:hypothetical protein
MKLKMLLLGMILLMSAFVCATPAPLSPYITRELAHKLRANGSGPVVTYKYGDSNIVLRQNLSRVAVQLSDYNRGVAMRSNRVLRSLTHLSQPQRAASDYERSSFIMEWQEEDFPSTQTWQVRANALRGNSSIKAVWPVYVYPPTGIDIYCAGEISAKLAPNVTTTTVQAAVSRDGLYLTSPRPNSNNTLVLRMKDPTVSDPFALAQKWGARKDLFAWVAPNLTQSYRLDSNRPPWDGLSPDKAYAEGTDGQYSKQWHLPKAHFDDLWKKTKGRPWPATFPDPPSSQTLPRYYEQEDFQYIGFYENTRPPVVAIVDTGVYWNHPDIWPNTWQNWSELQDSNKPWDGTDADWNGYPDDLVGWDFYTDANGDWNPDPDPTGVGSEHGTACAGIACARGFNDGQNSVSNSVRGGAPFFWVMGVRIA